MDPGNHIESTQRRVLLASTLLGAMAAAPAAADEPPKTPMSATVPLLAPKTEFVYEAIVNIAPPMQLGQSPLGERRIVPITGGTFEGPRLRGKVLPGGADRQLVRRDGARLLDALYELQTDDGAVITVHNKVLVNTPKDAPRYAFSTLEITAPEGSYGWLNNFVYVGSLDSLQPQRLAGVIRVFKLT